MLLGKPSLLHHEQKVAAVDLHALGHMAAILLYFSPLP
jgi:hypothetical protein